MDTLSILIITMGHNSVNLVKRVTVLLSADYLIMVYICTRFHENILNGFTNI